MEEGKTRFPGRGGGEAGGEVKTRGDGKKGVRTLLAREKECKVLEGGVTKGV